MRKSGLVLVLCALLAMAALPAVAAPNPVDRVPAGVDYWQTLSFGATAYGFARDPLPAGFFCAGSAPFTGEVMFEGVPLHTEPAGILGTTDTVIERLDDAVFNARGVATSRLRARALNLRATEPVKTACGSFKVTASLTEDQPVTSITFHRRNKYGGIFNADLRLRIRIDFTHLQTGKVSSLVREVYLPTVGDAPFACGKAAVAACTPSAEPVNAAAVKLVADGRPLMSARPGGQLDKATTSTCVTGCLCQTQTGADTGSPPQCLTTYCWHDPCRNNPDCEKHFTHTPCELGYEQFCDSETTQANYLEQLRVLREMGIVNEKPETILKSQTRSAGQIGKDQARKDREAQKQ
jgi:hypothetical protein